MKRTAILLAAGRSDRMGLEQNKVFIEIDGKCAVQRCLETLNAANLFSDIILVVKAEDLARGKAAVAKAGADHVRCCIGGSERQYSVRNALRMLEKGTEIVAVHDAARCFVNAEVIENCVKSAERLGSGIAGIDVVDTVKVTDGSRILNTLERDRLTAVQTPQAFQADLIQRAYRKAEEDGYLGTDDASLAERLGERIYIAQGSRENIKLTYKEDLDQSRKPQQKSVIGLRIGNGYDMHTFSANRPLILGGVIIRRTDGLAGHSDADVLVHAIMDALLGAAGYEDIGKWFPDTDEKYKDARSIELLKTTVERIAERGFSIVNIDCTLIMQSPKIAPYRESMRRNIARALDLPSDRINIKATTTEGLGAVGRKEGAAAFASCLLMIEDC